MLVLGGLSTLLVVFLVTRADLIDREMQPVLLKPSVLLYWVWLAREIIKSNIDVSRRILDPRMPISPNIFTVRAAQKTDLGRVTYANSITLVPGTVTMDVADAVKAAKGGEVQFKVEKAGVIHAGVGKASFSEAQLVENIRAFVDAVSKLRPAGTKGTYMKSIAVSSTMGPGVTLSVENATGN